jgi:TPP-dependent pyruvate/acetoin dehydrogenase alpha subunit
MPGAADLADFTTMLRIRRLEEEIYRMCVERVMTGSTHLCIGQEAIPAGAIAALDMGRDLIFPTYRGHGWAVACGVPMEGIFAELLGRETGVSGGRGGSAYFTAPQYGFYGENSIVGAGAPIATGAAIASNFAGSDRVVVCSIGDGAMNQGSVHEAMNFAAVRSAPVLFVIENNKYSELTPISTMSRGELADRAAAYGFEGVTVDGNDVAAIKSTVAHAAEIIRAGNGPFLIEAKMERFVGHYTGDAQQYRPAGEIDRARLSDPIPAARKQLLASGTLEQDIVQIEESVEHEVDAAVEAALEAQQANPATLLEHVYA